MYKKILQKIKSNLKRNSAFDSLYKSEDHSVLARKPHFIFSAENPMYPENHTYNLTHKDVVQMLKGKGYNVEEVQGHYGKPERSILVHNPSLLAMAHLRNLAKKLGQESSISSDGYNHELHFHGGPNAGLHVRGQGTTFHKRKPDDHFTELKDGTSFSHILNFDEAHPRESSIFIPKDTSTKKSEVDFIKSEPNHPLVGAGPDTKLIHFSPTSGLKNIDPNFQGQRIKDASSKYGRPEHPVSFFYLHGAKPEDLVTQGSRSKYVAKLGHRKLYDLGTDPENIRAELREASKNRQINPNSFTRDELDGAIKARGYHGIYNSAHENEDMRKVVGLYHSIPVEKEVAYHPRDAEMATDQAFEVHHSLNKSIRRFFVDEQELEDIEKAGVVSPSKHIGLSRLKQIKQDHNLGAGGKDYSEEELNSAIQERSNSQANKMVSQHIKREKQMAKDAEAQAKGDTGPAFPPPLPKKSTGIGIGKPTPINKFNPQIRDVADKYAQSRGLKLNHNIPAAKVDPKNAARIADAYHNAQHMPSDPHVKSAYDALIGETNDQFKHILNSTGLRVTKMQPNQENPYKTSKDLFNDIKNNNHMFYFPTDQGYGSDDQINDHPMLQTTEHIDNEGKPMLANDVFRIVHDYFGHAKEENGFGPNGEEGAWQHHMQMFSPLAQKALTAETRGQNSWVNFGPHGESNRANPANTKYADQKATILPDWAHNHGEQSVYSQFQKSEDNILQMTQSIANQYDCNKSGSCIPVTEKISQELMKQNIPHTVHEGYVNYFNEKGKKPYEGQGPQHTWIELHNGQVIDHTMGQFNHYLQPNYTLKRKRSRKFTPEQYLDLTKQYPSDHNEYLKQSLNKTENDLNKALSHDELKAKGYRFRYLNPTQKRDYYVVAAYHGKQKVGHVLYSKYPDKQGYHSVPRGHVEETHRGQGIYQNLLKLGSQHVKTLSPESKGLKSEGYQRSMDATHAWDKVATHAEKATDYTIRRPQYRADYFIKNENDLNKAPIITDQSTDFADNTLQSASFNPEKHTMLATTKLKNGLTHHVFHDTFEPNKITHTLSQGDPKQPVSAIIGRLNGKIYGAYNTATHIDHRRKNLSTGLKYRALKHHGNLESDSTLSEPENKTWHKLKKLPNVEGDLMPVADVEDIDPDYDEFSHTNHFLVHKPKIAKSTLSGKHLQRLETLKKGAMNRLAPYDPNKNTTKKQRELINDWTEENPDPEARKRIPKMHANARMRALHKLSGKTKVLRHPKTGERMFLLHRGMSTEEYAEHHQKGVSQYKKSTRTSWTPHYQIALNFSRDHATSSKNYIASAWIPESEIHSIPNAVTPPDQNPHFRDEHEVIVRHQTVHPHASKKHTRPIILAHKKLQPQTLHEKINTRPPLSNIKKGAMNRLAPYDPNKHITGDDHRAIENWTSEGDDQDARANVPEMHANAKVRALHKLSGMTEVRRHPKTGERMFLLHRGMSLEEYELNHRKGVSNYAPATMTSWTPKLHVAKGFASDHATKYDIDDEEETPNQAPVVSAWIPESEIHNIPNAAIIPDENAQFRNEHEVIVNHRTAHPHAHPNIIKRMTDPHNPKYRPDLNRRINERAEKQKQAVLGNFGHDASKFKKQLKASKQATEFKQSKFGKREAILATLEKGDISNKIKGGMAGLAVAASTLTPMNADKMNDKSMEQNSMLSSMQQPQNHRKERILNSIMDVESSGGRNVKHKAMPQESIHRGEKAYGSYGLMPMIIRETIKKNPELSQAHGQAVNLIGDEMHAYMNKNPDLEKQIAMAHYDRLARHFGDDPKKIGFAWLNGVTGTHRALKEKRPLDKHYYVKRILKAYEQHKKPIKINKHE